MQFVAISLDHWRAANSRAAQPKCGDTSRGSRIDPKRLFAIRLSLQEIRSFTTARNFRP